MKNRVKVYLGVIIFAVLYGAVIYTSLGVWSQAFEFK